MNLVNDMKRRFNQPWPAKIWRRLSFKTQLEVWVFCAIQVWQFGRNDEHFAMNIIVFELLPRGKEMTQKDLYTKNNRDMYKLYLIYLYLFTVIYTGISIHQQSKAKNSTKINLQILTWNSYFLVIQAVKTIQNTFSIRKNKSTQNFKMLSITKIIHTKIFLLKVRNMLQLIQACLHFEYLKNRFRRWL